MSETRLTSIFDRPAADPAPDLHVAAAETRCERVDRVFAKIGRDRITRMGLVGNERFAAIVAAGLAQVATAIPQLAAIFAPAVGAPEVAMTVALGATHVAAIVAIVVIAAPILGRSGAAGEHRDGEEAEGGRGG